jgi:hypothetical protein
MNAHHLQLLIFTLPLAVAMLVVVAVFAAWWTRDDQNNN